LQRYNVTWDVELVLTFLKNIPPVHKLPLSLLTKKLTILLLLLSGQRCQTIQFMDIRNMSVTHSKVTFVIGDLTKTSRPNNHSAPFVFKAYAPNGKLSVLTVLKEYLTRTEHVRGSVTALLITTKRPYNAASNDTIRRWTRDILTAAGIDINIFKAHSTRAASTSCAAMALPLSTIIRSAGWSSTSTFTKYYQKPIEHENCLAEGILGPHT